MKLSPKLVIDFVTKSYLANQKALTAKEIAELIGYSPQVVGKVLNEIYRSDSSLSCSNGERPKHSRDFPWMVAGYHRVTIWEPSKAHLVKLINEGHENILK